MARKAAIRHPDFTIVFRKDRNGYEGWHSGKAEAFRKTAAKVEAFFMKKYGKPGIVLENLENVRTYNLPVVEPVKPSKAKAKPAPVQAEAIPEGKANKGKRVAPVLEPEDFEETDLDPLALL